MAKSYTICVSLFCMLLASSMGSYLNDLLGQLGPLNDMFSHNGDSQQAQQSPYGATYSTKHFTEVVGNQTSWIEYKENDASVFVVNGEDATEGAQPWMISIQVGVGGAWYHICGGSLVRDNRVVTAAHCAIYFLLGYPNRVALGIYTLSGPNPNAQIIDVADFIPNEKYESTGSFPNDIAVVKLVQPANINDFVKPIELSTMTDGFYADENCVSTGWGYTTAGGSVSNILQTVDMLVLSYTDCKNFYGILDVDIQLSQVCGWADPTKPRPISLCSGDSGGPLVCDNKLVGVVSFGTSFCDGCFPNGYARVAYYQNWLNRHL